MWARRSRAAQKHIGVDTLRLLLAVLITPGSGSANAGGIHLLPSIATAHPRITTVRSYTGY